MSLLLNIPLSLYDIQYGTYYTPIYQCPSWPQGNPNNRMMKVRKQLWGTKTRWTLHRTHFDSLKLYSSWIYNRLRKLLLAVSKSIIWNVLNSLVFLIFILCVWIFGLCIHLCTMCMPSAHRGQKRASGPSEQMAMTCIIGAKIDHWFSARAASAFFNCWAVSLAPINILKNQCFTSFYFFMYRYLPFCK